MLEIQHECSTCGLEPSRDTCQCEICVAKIQNEAYDKGYEAGRAAGEEASFEKGQIDAKREKLSGQ